MTSYDSALTQMRAEKPDLERVRRLLDEAIDADDPRAFYALATWYLHGTHVRKSLRKGIQLLRIAADHKLRDALFDLAVLYERGRGLPKDEQRAFGLYKEAADRGDPQAMTEVGRMLYHGIGVAEDREKADFWLVQGERETAVARERKRAVQAAE